MDYINPFSAMSGDTSIESPFLRDQNRAERTSMAMPFLDMARQNQQMDIQKKQMEHSEFASPLAQQLRQQTMQTGLVKQQQTARQLPWDTDEAISNAKKTITSNPAITQKMIDEADSAAMKARGHPAAQLFNDVAAVQQEIKKLPSEAAQRIYAEKFIEQFKAKNPGATLPKFMETYDPIQWDLASLIAINNAEHQRKQSERQLIENEHMKRTEIESGDRRYQADRQYDRAVDSAVARNGTNGRPMNESQHRVSLRQKINDPSISEDDRNIAREEMRGYLDKQALDEINARFMEIASTKDLPDGNPKKVTANSIRQEVYARNGLTGEKPSGAPKTTINIEGKTYEVLGKNQDGTTRIRDPQTGKTGTVK